MKVIIHFVRIHASPQTVYQSLTTQKGLAAWWSTKVELDRAAVGAVVDWTFMRGFNPDMEIVALEENGLVKWKCVAGHDNWKNNTFAFEIRARQDGECDLLFRQDYAQELADEVYGEYNFNWGYYLGSLKQLCETGMGYPFQAS